MSPRSTTIPSLADPVRVRRLSRLCCAATVVVIAESAAAAQAPPSVVVAAVAQLGDLDYARRTTAARTVRRAPVAEATAALADAVAKSPDAYVQFRAFVLLCGISDARAREVARASVRSPNDRLRQVAYDWLERHPDPTLTAAMLMALDTEQAEFVRPSLVRALSALDDDARVRTALVRETVRGLDIFRSTVIEALGYRRAAYAQQAIAGIAALDGPLQDDAAMALGRIGGPAAVRSLAAVKVKGSDAQIIVRVATCLAEGNCGTYRDEIIRDLPTSAAQGLAGTATSALAALAERGDTKALAVLTEAGLAGARDLHDAAAVAVASVALRQPAIVLSWMAEGAQGRDGMITLLHDGFDMLDEDLAEESFYAAARAAYWQAPEGSDRRSVLGTLIDRLEF